VVYLQTYAQELSPREAAQCRHQAGRGKDVAPINPRPASCSATLKKSSALLNVSASPLPDPNEDYR
jgi:hypothetical protein